VKKFDAGKTRMIRLPYGEKNYEDMLSRFHLIPERYGRTDRQTDRRTDRFAISNGKFHVYRCNMSSLQDEKPIFEPLSKNNTGIAALRGVRAGLPVTRQSIRITFEAMQYRHAMCNANVM